MSSFVVIEQELVEKIEVADYPTLADYPTIVSMSGKGTCKITCKDSPCRALSRQTHRSVSCLPKALSLPAP
jgi:hypothetical protein